MSAHTPPHPVCPTCGMPAVEAHADPRDGWECGNEACPEFGQAIEKPSSPPAYESRQGNVEPQRRAARPIAPGTRIGHVHLRTADIDRVRDFYVGILGFDVNLEARNVPGWGTTGDVLFVAAGGYHHHLGFNTWKSADGPPQPDGHTGLHHVAIAYPTRGGLADAYARLKEAGVPIRQATDHGTHEAIYVSDPDGNDLELMWDRPFDEWPVGDLGPFSSNSPLDLDALLEDA